MANIFEPNIQIVSKQGVKTPCLAKIYRDGQWRQCNLNYYKLYPLKSALLMNEPIDATIYDIEGMPIHLATNDYIYTSAKYFDIDGDGYISLKSQYRGDYAKETYTYAISDNGAGNEGSELDELPEYLYIPDHIDGVEVKGIHQGAFCYNRKIKDF